MSKILAGSRFGYSKRANLRGQRVHNIMERSAPVPQSHPGLLWSNDPILGAAYIRVLAAEGTQVVRTQEFALGEVSVLIDLDKYDRALGVEVLYQGTATDDPKTWSVE